MSKLYFTKIFKGAIIIGAILLQISCGNKESSSEAILAAESYELEIIDSVMIDYLGALSWSDISRDGNHILGYDNQKMDVMLFSKEGEVLGAFNKTGDQPDAIGGSPLSRPQFVKQNEWGILGKNGVFAYDFNGQLTRKAKPDFPVSISLTISNANILHFLDEDIALAHFMGRDGKGTFYVNPEITQLEKVDFNTGDFSGVAPIPSNSKYNNPEKIHNVLTVIPAMDIYDGKLYIAFKNEPKLWIYDLNNLDQPKQEINIAFDKFIEKEGLSPDAVDRDNFGINSKDFTYGSIEKILVHKDIIIMQYAEGLTEAEYKAASEGLDNPMDLFSKLFAANKSQFGLLGADGQIKPITLPERVGNIEFIDQEGNIWISYNREEELDYELIFKANLKAVK